MSLQRRLMLYLLVCAPLVWSVALLFSVDRSRYQVNELYDTELIRLARQVLATQRAWLPHAAALPQMPPLPAPGARDSGESDVRDLAEHRRPGLRRRLRRHRIHLGNDFHHGSSVR